MFQTLPFLLCNSVHNSNARQRDGHENRWWKLGTWFSFINYSWQYNCSHSKNNCKCKWRWDRTSCRVCPGADSSGVLSQQWWNIFIFHPCIVFVIRVIELFVIAMHCNTQCCCKANHFHPFLAIGQLSLQWLFVIARHCTSIFMCCLEEN